jgi:hypothetical protein
MRVGGRGQLLPQTSPMETSGVGLGDQVETEHPPKAEMERRATYAALGIRIGGLTGGGGERVSSVSFTADGEAPRTRCGGSAARATAAFFTRRGTDEGEGDAYDTKGRGGPNNEGVHS